MVWTEGKCGSLSRPCSSDHKPELRPKEGQKIRKRYIACQDDIITRRAINRIAAAATIDSVIAFGTIKYFITGRAQNAVLHRAADDGFEIQDGVGAAGTTSGQINSDPAES